MSSRKILKKESKKTLISMIQELEMRLGKISLELGAEEYVHAINKTALQSAESALVYKEKEIEYKNRLLSSIIQ